MGNLSGESREQNQKDKVTRFCSVTYARQLGLLVNTLVSHLKESIAQPEPRVGNDGNEQKRCVGKLDADNEIS